MRKFYSKLKLEQAGKMVFGKSKIRFDSPNTRFVNDKIAFFPSQNESK